MERDGEAYKTGTVLVVEDEQTNLKLIHRMLQRTSYNIISSRNGQQAVQDYRQHAEIDVVLMDIRMPVMNGDEAAREILKINPKAKIIAQTAYAMQEEREKFLEIGFVDYISKPYKREEVIAVIDKWSSRQGHSTVN